MKTKLIEVNEEFFKRRAPIWHKRLKDTNELIELFDMKEIESKHTTLHHTHRCILGELHGWDGSYDYWANKHTDADKTKLCSECDDLGSAMHLAVSDGLIVGFRVNLERAITHFREKHT